MVRLLVAPTSFTRAALGPAVDAVVRGGIVAMPTDTLYGLAVDPGNAAAVQLLYELKGRPSDRAVPLIAADVRQVEARVGRLSPLGRQLAAHFWPGPLTLVIPAAPALAPDVHGRTGRVAVRVPAHAVARALCELAARPLTATSANRSGAPPAVTADEVAAALGDRLDVIVDAGPAPGGAASTIVDVTGRAPILVRPGAVSWDRVLEFLEGLRPGTTPVDRGA